MSDQNSEFAAVKITRSQLVSWPRVAAVAAMVAFSLPTFITGLEVYHALTPWDALWALILGSLIIFVIGSLMGGIGAHTRMSSYLLVRVAFGDKGAGVVNIAFAISLLGWFGININLFADAVGRLAMDVFGLDLAPLLLTVIASVCMTVTTVIGFRAINILATLMVPVLAVVTILLAYNALQLESLTQILSVEKVATLSLGSGISAVVGAIIIGAIILPDITRFVRTVPGAVYTAFIAYIAVDIVVMGAASLAGATTGQTDILDIMLELGLGVGAFIIVIAGSWILNSLNLYSAVLSINATFPRLNSKLVTVGLGAIGVVAALMNILDSFVTFLIYLSIIFVPVAGVILADFLFIRRSAYVIESLENNRALNAKGFTAWSLGALLTLLNSEGVIPALTGIPAIDAIVVSGGVYTLLAWNERSRLAPIVGSSEDHKP